METEGQLIDGHQKNHCELYKKPTDTAGFSNFDCCAPFQHKEIIWSKYHYPEGWTSRIINDNLRKIKPQLKTGGENVQTNGTPTI